MYLWRFERGEWTSQLDERTEVNRTSELRRLGYETSPFMTFGDIDRCGEIAFEVFIDDASQHAEKGSYYFEITLDANYVEGVIAPDFPSFLELLAQLLPVVEHANHQNKWEEALQREEARNLAKGSFLRGLEGNPKGIVH